MIYLIVGENAYEAKRETVSIAKDFGETVEHVDGSAISLGQLADLVRAQSLFATRRCIVCRGLSENKAVWDKLGEWANEVADDTALILVESKIDKRTKGYKAISARSRVITVDRLGDRDWRVAESWLDEYAHAHKVKLSRDQLREMVLRANIPDDKPGRQLIDQQMLATAVDALSSLEAVDDAAIATVMPQTTYGTLFDVLSYAVARDQKHVDNLLMQLRRQEDPHYVFPSLMNQWFQLTSIALAGERSATELGIHPYAAQKLAVLARDMSHTALKEITHLAARLDADMKRSAIDPWDAVNRFVLAIIVR